MVASGETEKEGSTSFDIAPGDALRVTCVFDTSNRTSATRAGWGHGDEMCNLYLMVHAAEPRYASCTGSASGGGGRSKFDFESRVEKTKTTPVAAAATGAFVVPPPAPLGAPRARSWPASIGQVSGVAFEPNVASLDPSRASYRITTCAPTSVTQTSPFGARVKPCGM